MQKRLRSRGLRTLSGQKLKMRVGLHWGPVVGGVSETVSSPPPGLSAPCSLSLPPLPPLPP
eukprot:766514-Hanusia_phi.AAC.2